MKKSMSIITAVTMTVLSVLFFKASDVTAEEKQPVEIVSLRSEYEKHFDNGNGTRTAYINTVPIHYLENGEWVEIDNSLVLDEAGNYNNIKSPLSVTLPSTILLSYNESNDNSSVKLDNNSNSIFISLNELLCDCEDIKTKDNYIEAKILDVDNSRSDNELPLEVVDSFDNAVSSISYMYENKKIVFDIRPNSLIEKIYLDEEWESNNSLRTYIKADSLTLKKDDEGNIDFIDIDDTIAFTMLSPTIVDSSLVPNNIPIKVDVDESEEGYCFSFSIDESIDNMENPTYPLILSTEYTIQRSSNTRYNSEAYPYDNIYDQYMYIGNQDNNGYQTFVSCSNPFLGLSEYVTITDATFNMYIIGNNLPSIKALSLYSLNTQPMNCCWNNASTINNSNTFITGFYIENTDVNSWKEISITRLVQSWFNYDNTSQNVGVAPYGFKMITTTDPKATIVAYSERASVCQPYFEISYVDDEYKLKYEPDKYNNIRSGPGNIYNFQNRMNCYAYALQVYYRGYLSSDDSYQLKPGEFGISEHTPNIQYLIDTNKVDYTYNFMNYAELEAKYADYVLLVNNDACSLNDFASFIEEQMYKDAQALNFDIKKHSFNGSNFILPIDFDEDSERIIAMITYEKEGGVDAHFYLRNGNGTCPDHGGDCSIWSHKIGNNPVKNTSHATAEHVLCDQYINYWAKMHSQWHNDYHNSDVNYYCISQDACVYNSYHTNGHVATSTGTPYYSY